MCLKSIEEQRNEKLSFAMTKTTLGSEQNYFNGESIDNEANQQDGDY